MKINKSQHCEYGNEIDVKGIDLFYETKQVKIQGCAEFQSRLHMYSLYKQVAVFSILVKVQTVLKCFPASFFFFPSRSENVFAIYDRNFRAHFSPSQYGSGSLIVSCGNSQRSVGVHIVRNDKTEPEARKYAQGNTLQPLTWITSTSRICSNRDTAGI